MREATGAQERGEFDQAAAAYSELTHRFPSFPDAWHYFGVLLHQRGEHARAVEMMRRADRLEPNNLSFLLNMATVLREQGRLNESLEVLARAHAIDPEHAQVLTQLIQIHLLVQRGGDLVEELELRIERAPNNWRLWMLLAECCEQGGERERALAVFSKAARLAPTASERAEAHLRRGWAARGAGDAARAAASFRDAADAAPNSGWARVGLATIASERGDFREAERQASEALRLEPAAYAAWRVLANTAADRNTPEFLRTLQKAAAAAGDDPQAWLLHFAHGQALEKRGDYDSAFAAYARGNLLRRARRPYSRVDQDDYTNDIIQHCGRAFGARSAASGMISATPIFICGMPRSGTTLVESVIAAHPDVTGGGEMRHIHDQMRRRLRGGTLTRIGTWLSEASDETLREIAEEWSAHLQHAAADRPWITDKMPGNFAFLGLIHLCFPHARIVHVRRNARDTGLSCFATPFSEGLEFSLDLADIGHFYIRYLRLIEHWRRVLGPQRIIEIRYEDLVREPENTARRLLSALGLEWDPSCLDFHSVRRNVSTASVYQVRQPIYTGSIGRWKRFARHLAPLIAALDEAPPRPD